MNDTPTSHRSAAREIGDAYEAGREEGLIDGVCLAIDELRAMGSEATAETLFKRMFVPAAPVLAAARDQAGTSPAASGEPLDETAATSESPA